MNSTTKSQTSIAKFEEFFATLYKDDVFSILEKYPDERTLNVDYTTLEIFDPDLADLLIEKPEEVINSAKIAIKNIDPLVKDADLNIRFEHLSNIIPLKTLLSKYIGTFVAADGIVRKTDEIRPRIETGVFECRGCMRLHEVEQTSANHIIEPSLCSECGGRSFRLLQEESKYVDTQTARMQEPLENLSGGTEPKQMLMILEDDLVDKLNPGDKVRITGTLKTFREERSGKFKNYIYVNHIEALEQEFEELHLSEEDEEEILELSKDPHIYEKIIKSTAPSIKGYRDVKEAIALQLFGGASKQLEDETKLRGDIHILIVGDPGIGKSQILKYVSRLAPRSIYTSGKGTTGAGLTAAAVRDELGGWSLEAGALVLGDQGNVCVDELDKMRSEDRSALHEALEQQTVSIAKAGIMATLNSRCSVLAAANPKFGRFDRYKILAEQIDLPAPIISRFDLIFVIEDKPSREKDSELAEHILKTHQFNTVDYEIEPELLRKYIAYARKNVNPRLTEDANNVLKEFYVSTRNSNPEEQGAVPITARQLEAIIRLSEASAKIKLKETVEREDAEKAVRLQMACLKEVGVDPETGEIDSDIVSGGTPKSDRDKIKLVTEEIKQLEEEYNGEAPLNVILSNMSDKYGVSEDKTEQIIKNLRQKGVIYEPTPGYYKEA
ncbi:MULTISPECIES: minichromosome maintenance protein MCM [Methanobrevibacter]|nr:MULTISPECIES: minichromosome maintenance protein MCM [Methanobrevibacter]MBS7258636.1 minichromosome maintenance protein MCM [Methanobrevibacter sp.]MCI7428766.1 minichromosome maintenance protein MCM [Methanobrevibacter sp.]MDD6775839.1 minichromosome maintenance protein MCM [Methanobacteriaceae archaeon]MDY3096596.1 minichromosome maintenance protein MCM [Methanobrevibacter sp.]